MLFRQGGPNSKSSEISLLQSCNKLETTWNFLQPPPSAGVKSVLKCWSYLTQEHPQHMDLCSLFFFFSLEHPHLISAQENYSEKCFLRPTPFFWLYQFGIFTGLLGIRKRDGWGWTAPFKPNPNTSPDLVQPIRKGNLAPGEDRVWSLHLAGGPATSEWTFQMRYSVTKKQ